MKKIVTVLLFCICFGFGTNVHSNHIPHQELVKGRSTAIETEYEIGNVAIADHAICDFMVPDSRREIYLNPRGEGTTTLTVWDVEGKKRDVVPLEVCREDIDGIVNEAKEIFSDSNVEVVVKGRKIILRGEATSKVVLGQAVSLADRYPEVENRVRMSEEVLQAVAERIEAAIATPGIRVRNLRGRLVLEGVAYSKTAAKRAAEIARLYEPEMLDLLEVRETGRRPSQDKLVKLDVYFMEIKKEALKKMGIRWSPGSMPKKGDGKGGIGSLGTSMLGFIFNLLPKINLLREKGKARVLEKASFVVKNGEVGDFFNGAEIPYYSGQQVVFKNVGVKVHVEPIAMNSDIDLKIDLSLSSPSANIEGAIDRRSISTNAYVTADESIVLAGMISNRDVTVYNKKPSDLDTSSAIFNLALSKDFQSGRSEFMVFVKPSILDRTLPAEAKLKEYLALEEDMIKTRSKKEYREHMAKRGKWSIEKIKPRRRRRRWR